LVLLHGFTGGPSSWDAVVASLHTPALRLTVAGHLDAPPPHFWAQEVARLTALLPAEPVHLAGYSLGGRLALAIAAASPARIARLSLIGAHPGLPTEDERRARREVDARWVALLRTGDIHAFATAWEAQPLFAGPDNARRTAARALRRRQEPHCLATALDVLGLGRMPLVRAACPVRAIAAARDTHIPADRRVAGGHDLLADAPTTVAEFLEEP
jgi:2-succinyl-6-hydroxy-2,4-cyclohexadiene-1-carboxylate synthase